MVSFSNVKNEQGSGENETGKSISILQQERSTYVSLLDSTTLSLTVFEDAASPYDILSPPIDTEVTPINDCEV